MQFLHKYPLHSFFFLTFAISWSLFGTGILQAGNERTIAAMLPFIIAGSFGPTLAALIMLATGPNPKANLVRWLKSLVRLKAHPFVYLLVMFLYPLIACALMLVMGIGAVEGIDAGLLWLTLSVVTSFNALVSIVLGAGPLGEEPGWRGYAQPLLASRFGDIKLAVILGSIWALWHLPVMIGVPDWRSNLPVFEYLPLYMVGVIAIAYTMSKIWRWSHGSVFMCIWLHGVVNAVGGHAFDAELWTVERYSEKQLLLCHLAVWLIGAMIMAVLSQTQFAKNRPGPLATIATN